MLLSRVFSMTTKNTITSVLIIPIIIATGTMVSLSLSLAVYAQNATQINITSVGHHNANFSARLSS
jgi:hypothetical protein